MGADAGEWLNLRTNMRHFHSRYRGATPAIFGTLLFAFNNAPILLAYLNPPPSYTGSLLPMHMDFQQYRTWIEAYRRSGAVLLPDYHAPWSTEPALLNPFCWFVGRTSAVLGIDGLWIYYLLTLLLTIGGVYALLFTVHAFTESSRQARTALLLSACCVPIPSILALSTVVFGANNQALGLIAYVAHVLNRYTSDSFWNGISGGPLVLFGTVTTILCMGLLAKYLKTDSPAYLRCAAFIAGIAAFVHPFEIFVVAGAGGLALLIRKPQPWSRRLRDAATFGLPGLLGLVPYLYLTSRHPWLKQAAVENRWQAFSPPMLLLMLGLPAVFCLFSFLLPLDKKSVTDSLLHCWFAVALIEVYVPFLPWQHHLLDGLNYAIALLAARQAARWAWARNLTWAPAMLLAACLAVHAIYWRDAVAAAKEPGGDASAVVSKTDRAVLGWLREHARADDLVLAPKTSAGWFATVPMHSFASHWLFSLTWEEQVRVSDAFYKGTTDDGAAHRLFDDLGIRYVVVPNGSPSGRYFVRQAPAGSVEGAAIYQLTSAGMQRYRPLAPSF